MRKKRPAKIEDLLVRAREAVASGRFRDTRHATERKAERDISLPEVRQVIADGWHERSKDQFKEEWQAWNYAIRGETLDGRPLRVVVSFDEEGWMLIITTIDLSR